MSHRAIAVIFPAGKEGEKPLLLSILVWNTQIPQWWKPYQKLDTFSTFYQEYFAHFEELQWQLLLLEVFPNQPVEMSSTSGFVICTGW